MGKPELEIAPGQLLYEADDEADAGKSRNLLLLRYAWALDRP